MGLYIPLFLSEVVGGNRKDKKACVILLVEKETEKATPLNVLFGWSLKIEERIRGEKTTVWTSEHLMMSQKRKKG